MKMTLFSDFWKTKEDITIKVWQLALSGVAGSVVFVLVLFGVIEATGAPPGGILGGAFIASVVSHALAGAVTTWLVFFGWSGCLAFVFALVGVFRRKRPWFIPLLWIVIVAGTQIGISGVFAVLNWLGSASPGVWDGAHTWSPPFWDAAAEWGASAMVGTVLLVTVPDFIRGLWQWSNGGSFGDGIVWFWVPLYSAALIPLIIAWAPWPSLPFPF